MIAIHSLRRIIRSSLALLGCAIASGGCAVMNRENTPAFNFVEDHLWPSTPGKQAAALPIVLPIGLVAASADAFVIHPATVVDDAVLDTRDALWKRWDWDKRYVTECMKLPWRVVLTPVFVTGDFAGRSLFDVPGRASQAKADAEAKVQAAGSEKRLEEIQALLDGGRPEEALSKAENERERLRGTRGGLSNDLAARAELLLARASFQCGDYSHFSRSALADLLAGSLREKLDALLDEMRSSDDPFARWKACELHVLGVERGSEEWRGGVAQALSDANPVVRSNGLREAGLKPEMFAAELERIAREDDDAYCAAYAKSLLARARN
ncbi:MAG: hypothetical protein NTW86_17920 [Candidatus Sumerlaeota bacterium]|nr:hypothetical protein [Candidatus Sumerlaeota bacterium]